MTENIQPFLVKDKVNSMQVQYMKKISVQKCFYNLICKIHIDLSGMIVLEMLNLHHLTLAHVKITAFNTLHLVTQGEYLILNKFC